MKPSYGQYCPLALSVELLCRRWTVLVISRLLDGCSKFNEIHRGVPRISPSLLSQRLREIEDYGLLYRKKLKANKGYSYHLTDSGLALDSIIMDLSIWGQHWARDMQQDDLDPAFLVWSMHLRVDNKVLPPGQTVIEFEFSGAPKDCSRFWLVANDDKVDMCLKNPGYETNLLVSANLLKFVETWRGFRDLNHEISSKNIRLTGSKELKKAFPKWLLLSSLAKYNRMKTGKEKGLYS